MQKKKRHSQKLLWLFGAGHLVASQRNRHFGGLPGIPSSSLPAHSQLTAEQPVLLPHSSYAEIERNEKAKMGREKLSHEQREKQWISWKSLAWDTISWKWPKIASKGIPRSQVKVSSRIWPLKMGDPQNTTKKHVSKVSLKRFGYLDDRLPWFKIGIAKIHLDTSCQSLMRNDQKNKLKPQSDK